jgi:hypothetical protein
MGDTARAWWGEHRDTLKPGTPLTVVLENPRSFTDTLMRTPYTAARVVTCQLAPLAPSWTARQASAAAHATAGA